MFSGRVNLAAVLALTLWSAGPALAQKNDTATAKDATAAAAAKGDEAATAPKSDAAVMPQAADGAAAVAGKKGDVAPPLAQWLADTKDAPTSYPHVMAFVTDLPDKGLPKFLDIDHAAFNALGYFQVPDQASVAWDMKLNRDAISKLNPFQIVLRLTKADTVVLAPPTGDWQFLRPGEHGERQVIATVKPPKSTKPEDIVAWLPATLGWDGVVLAQKGDFLLVGSTTQILATTQVQALAVSNSATKFLLKEDERKGAGLLSLSQTKEGVGIFDIVFLGAGIKALPVGTKLIIEKKK